MQPNNPPQHPIDYLDSISTAPKNTGGKVGDKMFFGIIIAAIATLILVVSLVVLSSGPSVKDELTRLGVRLENLQKISDDSSGKIVSSSLRATNANLSLTLTGANRDIPDHLSANGLDPEKPKDSIVAEEDTEELTGKLEDARLNAIFDRTYAREMTFQLGTLLVLIEQIEERSKTTDQKEFLSALYANLEPLQKQFSEFSAAS